MSKVRSRLSGTEGRPICKDHTRHTVLCWCGYIRSDIVSGVDRKDRVLMVIEDEDEQGRLFSANGQEDRKT